MLVEETILDEVAAQDADIVVIGSKQASRWRRMIRRLVDDPDVDSSFARNSTARSSPPSRMPSPAVTRRRVIGILTRRDRRVSGGRVGPVNAVKPAQSVGE